MTMKTNGIPRALLCILSAWIFTSACASRGPEVQTLGFLGDYTDLSPGREGQASLVYIDEEADFSIYTAILVEPVIAWSAPGDDPAGAPRELVKNLDDALRRELSRDLELVEQPRAGALRLRAALASNENRHLILEVEILDATTGTRLVAAVDDRDLEASDENARAGHPIEYWAALIPDRLATFRQFDAAARAREASETP
jgi:hypothetical protein